MAEDYVPGVRKGDREVIQRVEARSEPKKEARSAKELLMDTKVFFHSLC